MEIKVVTRDCFEQVLPLIARYQEFYRVTPDPARNRQFFSQFIDDHHQGILFLAVEGEKVLGFATLYFPFSSVRACRQCLLNDLFVIPEGDGRLKGVGGALVMHCLQYAIDHGYQSFGGFTEQSNQTAQYLYDNLIAKNPQYEASKSAWFEYSVKTGV